MRAHNALIEMIARTSHVAKCESAWASALLHYGSVTRCIAAFGHTYARAIESSYRIKNFAHIIYVTFIEKLEALWLRATL